MDVRAKNVTGVFGVTAAAGLVACVLLQLSQAHRTSARWLARLLPWFVTLLHAMLRIDWLKYIGSPSVASGVFALVPATWLVIRESFLVTKPVQSYVAASGR